MRRRRSILLSLEGLEDRTLLSGGPILDLAGFTANTLPANDDASTGQVNLGFTITFGGKSYSSLYVNDNGNVTFGGAMSTYTPYNLVNAGQPIIAPFFSDVDTRDGNLVSYGTDTVDGHAAFGVDWFNVNYFNVQAPGHVNKYNTFQLVLIDRSDLQAGDFDIEFNYGGISWETGDVSGGVNGLGGDSAFVGYSDGTGSSGNWYQFAGSGVPGSFLDSNTGTGLIYNSLNSGVTGRYVFGMRQSNSITTADASVVAPAPSQPVTLLSTVAAASAGSGTPTGTVTFSDGGTNLGTATLQDGVARLTLPNGLALGTHTIAAVYNGDDNFTGSQDSVTLAVKDPANDVPGSNCNCGCPNEAGDLIAEPADEETPAPDEFNDEPVRYADGVVNIAETDLQSDGFGYPWGQTRSWSNGGGYSDGLNGNGWVDTYAPPQLIRADGSTSNTLIAVANGTTAYYFTLVNGVYQPSFGEQSQLIYNSNDDTYTLIDGEGDQIVFDGFGSSWSSAQRGQFASYTSSDGVKMTASDNSNGQIAEMQRSAGGVTQTWIYSYLPSTDRNAGLLSNVQLLDSSGNIVRQVQYAYYDGTQTYGGNLGDLMTATVEDASGNALSTNYYRYYTAGEINGYKHGLKYVFNADSYERLTAAFPGTNVSNLIDSDVAPYADNYFQYDNSQRVTLETAAGAGDSQTGSPGAYPGQGTYQFSYTPSSNTPGYNSWQTNNRRHQSRRQHRYGLHQHLRPGHARRSL